MAPATGLASYPTTKADNTASEVLERNPPVQQPFRFDFWFWSFEFVCDLEFCDLGFVSRFAFQRVQLRARLAGVETGRGQAACQAVALVGAQRAGDSTAAMDSQTTLQSNDLAAGPSPGSIGPRAGLLVKLEERRHDLLDIAPIARIIGLKKQASA